MIKEYMTVREAAEKWEITIRAVQLMCTNKRIDGVVKFGKPWAIPINAERPTDGRVISGQYRNWRKNSKTRSVSNHDRINFSKYSMPQRWCIVLCFL